MSIYLFLLFVIFIFYLLSNSRNSNKKIFNIKLKDIYYFLSVSMLFFFSAFRYMIGWDYVAYYNTIKHDIVTNIVDNGEIINICLIDLARNYNTSTLYFAATSFIIIFGISYFIYKNSSNKWLSLFLFTTFPLFFLNSLSVIRFFSALSITLLGFKFIKEKKMFYYILIITIAYQFHNTAIFCMLFYFIDKIKLNKYHYICLLLFCPLIKENLIDLIIKYFPRYSTYLNVTNTQEGTKAIILIFIVGLFALFMYDIIKDDYIANSTFKIYFIGMCIYLMFNSFGTLGHRLSLYGTIYLIILLPFLIKKINVKQKYILHISVILLFLISYIYILNVGRDTYLPYKTIFNM